MTPAGASTSLTSRINGMTTHRHTLPAPPKYVQLLQIYIVAITRLGQTIPRYEGPINIVGVSCLGRSTDFHFAGAAAIDINSMSKAAALLYVCMVITYSRVWIKRVRLPILLVVS